MSAITIYPSLAGEMVFITGGATGIGAAMVEAFAGQGAKVGFVDLDADSADRLADDMEQQTGNRPWFQKVDVTDVPHFGQPFTRRSISWVRRWKSRKKAGAIVWR